MITTLAELIPSSKPSPEDLVQSVQLRTELDLLLTLALKTEERDVLRLRYGLDDGNGKSLTAIGKLMGLRMPHVRAIEQRALKSLRKPSFLERLEAFLHYDP